MSSLPKVMITETLDEQCAAWLAQHAEVIWCSHEETDRFNACLAEVDALVVRTYTLVDGELLDRAPRLKVVGRAGVGLDNFDLPACRQRGVKVVYTPDANTQAVVEYVFALLWDVVRPRTPISHPQAQHFHDLRKSEVGGQLEEMTIGILGFGRIGKRVGEVAHAIGMNIVVNDILPEAHLRKAIDRDFGNFGFEFVEKDELYARSNILTIHVDGRPENRHLIDAAALAQLKPNGIFLNVARGMLVDAHALADWAQANPQARVLLDVHEPEPPAADYPLWGMDNVTLLPHLASRTHTALKNMSWVVKDVVAVLKGEDPAWPA